MAIAASDAAIIFHRYVIDALFRCLARSLVGMTAPQFNLRGVWAEIARDPAKRLAQIVSITVIRGRLGCSTARRRRTALVLVAVALILDTIAALPTAGFVFPHS
jgi:hypothetical protein